METLREQWQGDCWYQLGPCQEPFEKAVAQLEARGVSNAIWGRYGELWSDDATEADEIEDRLGWLDLPRRMHVDVPRLEALAHEIQAAGIERVLLLGMGGSSLAPEVLREVFGVAEGHADLIVVDTTDPDQISRIEEAGDLRTTALIAASKSGTTAETLTLLEYFQGKLETAVGESWPKHVIVITDPGTPLAEKAAEEGYRACYANAPDVGGRYSALSLFGLVPAALIGIDCERLLATSLDMALRCRAVIPDDENPAAVLGAILGSCASQGRDKLTLLNSPRLASFGSWVEQLIAESTGKDGRGIVPVDDEPPMAIERYGDDRLFVYVRLREDEKDAVDALATGLANAGHPLVVLSLEDPYTLGAEFFRWEFATAVTGYLLKINPFDQPNVEAAKERARQALQRYEEMGRLDEAEPTIEEGELALYDDDAEIESIAEYLEQFLKQASAGDYVAVMAYMDRNEAHTAALQRIQRVIAEKLGVAATIGFGPRFLHSTGQLHKGGPNTGLFLQITCCADRDLEIPGREYGFGVLISSQAAGDLTALRDNDRRAIRVDIRGEVEAGLQALEQMLRRVLR